MTDKTIYPSLVHHPLPSNYYEPDLDPRRAPIRRMLLQNYRAMLLSYSVFSVGWTLLLFSPQKNVALGLILSAWSGYGVYGKVRNHFVRTLGFSRVSPFPSDWSREFHDREPEVFKKFTVFWTSAFFAWAIRRYFA